MSEIQLTTFTKHGGWAAKIGPDALAQVLCHLPKFSDSNLLVGFETSDDASVYRINDELCLVQTVDIFPPVVDDPYEYGQIAAANSLSDIYAMGAHPKLAMNIFCFPEEFPKETLQAILQGGYEKVAEAGAIITGGHTIQDAEPKYGLSVSGFAHPHQILRNNTAKPGDILILTKGLGTGILTTAERGNLLSEHEHKELIGSMASLNKIAAIRMANYTVSACTDITGFGFLGHATEMAADSGCSIHIDSNAIPALPGALNMAAMGLVPANAYKNREYFKQFVCVSSAVSEVLTDLLYDPQTSGGLLIALPEKEGEKLFKELHDMVPATKIVGHIEKYSDYPIFIK